MFVLRRFSGVYPSWQTRQLDIQLRHKERDSMAATSQPLKKRAAHGGSEPTGSLSVHLTNRNRISSKKKRMSKDSCACPNQKTSQLFLYSQET